MNKSIKIILLIVGILLAVGGVMAYYKTIVSPPGTLKFQNAFLRSGQQDMSTFQSSGCLKEVNVSSATPETKLAQSFSSFLHLIAFQQANELLNDQEHDQLLESFLKNYAPAYAQMCQHHFEEPVWSEEKMGHMKQHCDQVEALVDAQNEPIVQGEVREKLEQVKRIVANYYAAKNATAATGYQGIEQARQRIARAQESVSQAPLSNCAFLVERAQSLPARLGQAHYAYLVGQVERLRHYQNYTEEGYRELYLEIDAKLEEYKDQANSVYGEDRGISILYSRAEQYYSNATFESDDEEEFYDV